MKSQVILNSANLALREASSSDAAFVLALINQPAWKQHIANHSISTLGGAEEYIRDKLVSHYKLHGFGLWVVETKANSIPVGLCGLLKRDSLEHIDLGYGFLPNYWGQGFAHEASVLCLRYAFEKLEQSKVWAITTPANERSIKLLSRLQFVFKKQYSHPGSSDVLSLFELDRQTFSTSA